MTPEDIVKKYTKNITNSLDTEDKDILNAYINLEVDKRVNRRNRSYMVLDYGGFIIFGTLVVAFLGWGFTSIHDSYARAKGWNAAVAEQSALVDKRVESYKSSVQHKIDAAEIEGKAKIDAAFKERDESNSNLKFMSQQKHAYCNPPSAESEAPRGIGTLVLE